MGKQWGGVVAAIYALGFIICFGPATVQSERAQEQHAEKCGQLANIGPGNASACIFSGPSIADGLAKALAWPLWLSYSFAKSQ